MRPSMRSQLPRLRVSIEKNYVFPNFYIKKNRNVPIPANEALVGLLPRVRPHMALKSPGVPERSATNFAQMISDAGVRSLVRG